MDVDVAVIGAGILGCTMARTLARRKVDVCVVEAQKDVGEGATKANSGIIHAGFHPRGGSLKGTSCVQGNAQYDEIAQELGVPFKRIGALYVCFHSEGMELIKEKHERARLNGAGNLEIISGEEARALEPRLSKRVIAALSAPSTGIISPFELALATARNAVANGVQFEFDCKVEACIRKNNVWVLKCSKGQEIRARYVVNMAGDEAALLDALVHDADIVVRPRRGQYLVFDKCNASQKQKQLITHVLYQVQETDEGGTLLTPTIDGNLLAGPTSENVRAFTCNATSQKGIDHIKRVARKLVPDLDFGDVITEFSGIRANIVNIEKERKDFVVRLSASGFVSALGIKNPGMTCAPALCNKALDLLVRDGLVLEENAAFDAHTQGGAYHKPFMDCSVSEQHDLLARDLRYGHVVCRCERITEGDIRACLHDSIKPHTLDGIKRRLRCGMGRCQGSFCTPRIIDIMADELGCMPWEIQKSDRGGHVVKGRVK